MNTLVPQPIAVIQEPKHDLNALRINQRVTAEVLGISGDQVELYLQGIRVVARMASAELAASLLEYQTATFIVRHISQQAVNLQLVQQDATSPPPSQPSSLSFISNLLAHLGVETDKTNLQIARELLNQNLPVTKQLLEELRTVLAAHKGWGESYVKTAVALKAAGLPLTAQSLALAMENLPHLSKAVTSLQAQLEAFLPRATSPRLTQLTQNALVILQGLALDWSASPDKMAENLRRIVTIVARSLENHLSNLVQRGIRTVAQQTPGQDIFALALLRSELARQGNSTLLGEIDRFLEGIRQMQFINARPESVPQKGQWFTMQLPLGAPTPPFAKGVGGEGRKHDGHLRVAYRSEGQERKIDATQTRLIIEVDLDEDEILRVDLSVVERQIGARVKASNQGLLDLAQAELPDLKVGLEALGFIIKSMDCEMGLPAKDPGLEALGESAAFPRIYVEV